MALKLIDDIELTADEDKLKLEDDIDLFQSITTEAKKIHETIKDVPGLSEMVIPGFFGPASKRIVEKPMESLEAVFDIHAPAWGLWKRIRSAAVSRALGEEPKDIGLALVKGDRAISELPEVKSKEFVGNYRDSLLTAVETVEKTNPQTKLFTTQLKNTITNMSDERILMLADVGADTAGAMLIGSGLRKSAELLRGQELSELGIKPGEQIEGLTAEESAAVTTKGGWGEYARKHGAEAAKNLKAKFGKIQLAARGEVIPTAESYLYSGVPVPREIIDKFNLSPAMLENLSKGSFEGIPAAAITALTERGLLKKPFEKLLPQTIEETVITAEEPSTLDLVNQYEHQKDIWFQNKDERIFKTQVEKQRLQKDILASMNKLKYDNEAKNVDKAIQVYIDSKRNPEHVEKYFDQLTPEQQEIVRLSQNLPENIQGVADNISESYQNLGMEALEADVIKNVLDNYAGRIWEIPEKKTGIGRKFGTTTGHAKERKFETIIEGWAKGYNLKVEGSTNNLAILKEEIIKTIEDKKFLKSLQKLKTLDGDPLLSTKQLEGYTRVEHPNFKIWKHAGQAIIGESYGKNFFRDDKGNLFERKELYAPEQVAKNINNILGVSKLKDLAGIKAVTKYNAIIKSWILQSSFFHHFAFMRSYYLGTNHKNWSEMSIRQAYRQGLRAIEEEHPMIILGVRNGLTLGLKQDWNEELVREKTAIGELLDKWNISKVVKDKIMDLRQSQADFLFGKFGAGLKAKSFMIEYRNIIKRHPDKGPDELAKMVATIINDDFGGLHLQRMGRNPTVQHIFRLFCLAPDWTESNIRTMVKAIKAGSKEESALYRRFWAGILTKGILITFLANVLLNGTDTIKAYKRAWKEGRFRWLDIDITNIYKALGGKTDNHKYFSIFGHFKDPAKFITHPIRSAHYKGSVIYKFFHEALAGVDWASRRFTTASELLGRDYEKGTYKRSGAPKWGKLKGQTVTWTRGKQGPLNYNQIPSFILSQIKGSQPLQVQNLLAWFAGEMEGFDAVSQSIGLGVGTTYSKEKEKRIEKFINKYEGKSLSPKIQNLINKYEKW